MKRYSAIAATINKTKEAWNGTSQFTFNALDQLAASAEDKAVLFEFHTDSRVGTVIKAHVTGNSLVIIFDCDCDIVISDYRLVPGYQVNTDTWQKGENIHRIIDSAIILSFGLTMNPIETDLPLIEKYMGRGGKSKKNER